jgi:uncharacterized phage-like protein YoqJ
MALGWDTAVALAAIRLRIPLIAAVPFPGQQARWPLESRQRYAALLQAATHVHIISQSEFSPQAYHKRNRWMVDECNLLVALWNGTGGGTASCIAYAQQVKRPWVNLWSEYAG